MSRPSPAGPSSANTALGKLEKEGGKETEWSRALLSPERGQPDETLATVARCDAAAPPHQRLVKVHASSLTRSESSPATAS